MDRVREATDLLHSIPKKHLLYKIYGENLIEKTTIGSDNILEELIKNTFNIIDTLFKNS